MDETEKSEDEGHRGISKTIIEEESAVSFGIERLLQRTAAFNVTFAMPCVGKNISNRANNRGVMLRMKFIRLQTETTEKRANDPHIIFQFSVALGVFQKEYDVADGQRKVSQAPESAHRLAGENVTFYCAFPLFNDISNVNIYWWKLGDTDFLQSRSDSRKVIRLLKKGEATLQLLKVHAADSGVYYCGVKHLDRLFANGTGSKLVIYVPPIPLSIKSELLANKTPESLIISCKTAAFYPDGINVTWYKDGFRVATGINTFKYLNSEGLYELFSYLVVTRTDRYVTCQVTHRTLIIPVNASFNVLNWKVHRLHVALIPRFVLGFLVILILTIIIVDHFKRRLF
ncbi:natural cytotoxicity triggering receptor 3 ligand 1-like [Mustelus asterias]